jgi:cobalt/nickel transport system ATP-binding protein
VVADGPTREVLADEGFMRAHRLELPAGFNPLAA